MLYYSVEVHASIQVLVPICWVVSDALTAPTQLRWLSHLTRKDSFFYQLKSQQFAIFVIEFEKKKIGDLCP